MFSASVTSISTSRIIRLLESLVDLISNLYARCGLICKASTICWQIEERNSTRDSACGNPTSDRSHNRSDSIVNDPFRVLLHCVSSPAVRYTMQLFISVSISYRFVNGTFIFYSINFALEYFCSNDHFIILLLHACNSVKLQCSSVSFCRFCFSSYFRSFPSAILVYAAVMENVFPRISQRKIQFLLPNRDISFRLQNKYITWVATFRKKNFFLLKIFNLILNFIIYINF